MKAQRHTTDNVSSPTSSHVPATVAILTLPLLIGYWLSSVSQVVTEPYLDEVFHIRQAQVYCHGRLLEWDDKITTPPGLYLISYLIYKTSGFCGISALRALNAVFLLCIFLVSVYMTTPSPSRVISSQPSLKNTSLLSTFFNAHPQQIHTALNLCLFPPLFFFGGLYYTDVGSTLFVLLFLKHFFDIHAKGMPTFTEASLSIFLGLVALSFRQTNIFWVAVFPAGLITFSSLAEKRESARSHITRSYSVSGGFQDMIEKSWKEGVLYDPPVGSAWIDDYFMNIVSIVILAVRALTKPSRLLRIIRLLLPYLIQLALFGIFILWNGGVVLGDKSNHIATLHLPQMLYIWPFITFFSLPLIYPFLLQGGLALLGMIPVAMIFEPLLIFTRHRILPRPLVTLAFVALAVAIVHYNTIVHPFSLADNRHYTFYVIRILLLKHPLIRYLAAPIYLVSAWSVIQTLGASTNLSPADLSSTSSAFSTTKPSSNNTSPSPASSTTTPAQQPTIEMTIAPLNQPPTISLLTLWLLTSLLALVTAPLVEPRYFIIPWILWRLLVPLRHPRRAAGPNPFHASDTPGNKSGNGKGKGNSNSNSNERKGIAARIASVTWRDHDHRLWLETCWFLIVNGVTGYVFLYKGFEWSQERGRVQRFMW